MLKIKSFGGEMSTCMGRNIYAANRPASKRPGRRGKTGQNGEVVKRP